MGGMQGFAAHHDARVDQGLVVGAPKFAILGGAHGVGVRMVEGGV